MLALNGLRHFCHEHDDLPAFHAGYLVLTVIVAALLNMGAFAVLILAHMSLDFVKYRDFHGYTWRETLSGIFHENIVDIALLSIGVVFGVYLGHGVGIAGVSGLLRAEGTILEGLGTLIPKVEILHRFLMDVCHLSSYLRSPHPGIGKGWSAAEKFCIFLTVACVILLVFAGPFLAVNGQEFSPHLAEQMLPWRM
ncbi:MAG: hypothetical protein PHI23_03420 [Candidatus Peribacteraceae bacterium]|nr:hypothetical protein [Candidatus Peribacteraceae bacterium]